MAQATAAQQADTALKVEQLLRDRLEQVLLGGVGRHLKVEQITGQSGSIGGISVDRLVLGDATIERLVLTDTSVQLRSGSAYLSGVRTVVELDFALDWWIDIGIWSDSGTEDLPSLSFSMAIGNVLVPSLDDIAVSIPSVTADDVGVSVAPVTNLNLGGGTLTTIAASDAVLPADGFQMTGMGLGTLELSSLEVPRTTVEEASVGRFVPNAPIMLPRAQLGTLNLPAAAAGNIRSGAFAIDTELSRQGLRVDAGVFGVTIWAKPILHLNVQNMVLQDVTLAASVRQASLENMQVPIDLHGIKVNDIELNSMRVADVSM